MTAYLNTSPVSDEDEGNDYGRIDSHDFGDGHTKLVYRVREAMEDEFVNKCMEVEGWAMSWHVFHEWDNHRFVICVRFDGPMSAGAGAYIVDSVVDYSSAGLHTDKASVMAWIEASTYVTLDVTRQMMDNVL